MSPENRSAEIRSVWPIFEFIQYMLNHPVLQYKWIAPYHNNVYHPRAHPPLVSFCLLDLEDGNIIDSQSCCNPMDIEWNCTSDIL